MYLAKTDGTRVDLGDRKLPLEEAQRLVGGYVERVQPRQPHHDLIFLCDEEGLCKGKPPNQHGCELYRGDTPVVGDIIVIKRSELAARGWR